MMHDMNGWSFEFGHWVLGAVSWLVVILLIVALLKYLFGTRIKPGDAMQHATHSGHEYHGGPAEAPGKRVEVVLPKNRHVCYAACASAAALSLSRKSAIAASSFGARADARHGYTFDHSSRARRGQVVFDVIRTHAQHFIEDSSRHGAEALTAHFFFAYS